MGECFALPNHVAIRGGTGCCPAGTEPSQTAVPGGYGRSSVARVFA